jgi:myo-inositol 2-dehydrogenase/D-chiro-inositol 1-dehydrogenase
MDVNFATTAIHLIDAARFLAGSDYAQFNIHYQELPGLGPGVANYLLNGRFASGATVHLAITPVAGLNIERTIVYALDHTFLLQANNGPDAPGHLWHYSQGQLVTDLNAERFTGRSERYFLDGFYPEDAAFFDAIRAGRRPDPDFYSCHQSVEIMECLSQRRTGYP